MQIEFTENRNRISIKLTQPTPEEIDLLSGLGNLVLRLRHEHGVPINCRYHLYWHNYPAEVVKKRSHFELIISKRPGK